MLSLNLTQSSIKLIWSTMLQLRNNRRCQLLGLCLNNTRSYCYFQLVFSNIIVKLNLVRNLILSLVCFATTHEAIRNIDCDVGSESGNICRRPHSLYEVWISAPYGTGS